ncbi:MAG: DnaD domain protein [Lachnospiraceae bacterium]|nr:DnaD domain protein [Lachnospiraceae bacterium]
MGKIKLISNIDPCVTVIPNSFLDEYMVKASGDFLKIYLYLLRWAGSCEKELSQCSIADVFHMTESDIRRALRYWHEEGILRVSGLNSKESMQITLNPLPCDGTGARAVRTAGKDAFKEPQYSAADIRKFKEDYNGDELFFIIEQYLGHPLSEQDVNKIVYWHEGLGFSSDLIEYLVEYCVSNDHRQMRYIETVALRWAKDHVDTVEKAKQTTRNYTNTYYAVLKAMGISGRNPVAAEINYIDRWTGEYGFTIEMIQKACERTVLSTGKASFDYTDAILKAWKDNNVLAPEDIEAYDKKRAAAKPKDAAGAGSSGKKTGRNKFNDFPQRTYDFDDLEMQLINKINKKNSGEDEGNAT